VKRSYKTVTLLSARCATFQTDFMKTRITQIRTNSESYPSHPYAPIFFRPFPIRGNSCFLYLFFAFFAVNCFASTNDLATALQKGLFEEEANRNFPAAIEAYQDVINRFDEDRKLAATAIFRLGEIYRKQGKTNEASAQYERVVREFSDQSQLATLSQSYLGPALAINAAPTNATSESAPTSDEAEEVKKIRAMIRDSPDLINAKDQGGNTRLHTAALSGHLVVSRFLVENGANVNAQEHNGWTPLHIAASGGHKALVELLLGHGANARLTDANGNTPLHAAARKGFRSIVEVLLAHGADVNAKNRTGSTPLHFAAANGFKSVAELLLSHHADVTLATSDARDEQQRNFDGTPLHIAAQRDDPSLAELLLANKANPNATNSNGETALHIAASRANAKLIQLLLEKKSTVDAIDKPGDTPLDLAAKSGHTNAVETLLTHGAEVNARNPVEGAYNGWTPVLYAVANGHKDTVDLLLKRGADPNATIASYGAGWAQGTTPLLIAANTGEPDIAEALLNSKADPNAGNAKGLSPLFAAMAIQDPGPTPTGLPTPPRALRTTAPISAAEKRKQIITLLLDHGADTEAKGEQGKTLLMLACERKDKLTVDLLLSHKANVNAKGNPKGLTALHFAVFSLFNGADVEVAQEIIEALLAAGANVNLQSNDGKTALSYLLNPGTPIPLNVSATRLKIEQLLREHGAVTDLPRLDAIEVRRPDANYSRVIFTKGTNGWNQFTLFDLFGAEYNLLSSSPVSEARERRPINFVFDPDLKVIGFAPDYRLAFPDFKRIRIRHPKPNFSGWDERTVDIDAALASGDCSADVPLQMGDQVEIPEADHVLNSKWQGLTKPTLETLQKCLTRQITVVVKGESKSVSLSPDLALTNSMRVLIGQPIEEARPHVRQFAPFMIRPALNDSNLLLASSDLSHIKLIRTDPATGQKRELMVDCSSSAPAPSVWLRDGDLIEVPDKP
jgi:ankyrin repeat protein